MTMGPIDDLRRRMVMVAKDVGVVPLILPVIGLYNKVQASTHVAGPKLIEPVQMGSNRIPRPMQGL